MREDQGEFELIARRLHRGEITQQAIDSALTVSHEGPGNKQPQDPYKAGVDADLIPETEDRPVVLSPAQAAPKFGEAAAKMAAEGKAGAGKVAQHAAHYAHQADPDLIPEVNDPGDKSVEEWMGEEMQEPEHRDEGEEEFVVPVREPQPWEDNDLIVEGGAGAE